MMWQSSSLAVFWTSTRRSSWLTPAKRCGRRFQKLCSHANMCEAGTRPLVLTRTTNGVHPKWGSHAIIYTGRKRCVTHKLYAEATGIWHRGSHPSGRLPAVPHIETSPESLARLPRPELTSVPSEPTETSATLGLRPKQVGIQKDGRTRIKEKAKQEESIRNKTQGVKRREIKESFACSPSTVLLILVRRHPLIVSWTEYPLFSATTYGRNWTTCR